MTLKAALSVLVAAALVGCSQGRAQPQAPTATMAQAPPAAPTSELGPDDFIAPERIDAAYVERVMAALDRLYGEAARHAVRTGRLDRTFVERLRAIYDDEEFDAWFRVWQLDAAAGFAGLSRPPRDPRTTVSQLLTVRDDCVSAAVERDLSGFYADQGDDLPNYRVALAPLPDDRDPAGLNPTGWYLVYDAWEPDAPPEEPCAQH